MLMRDCAAKDNTRDREDRSNRKINAPADDDKGHARRNDRVNGSLLGYVQQI
jgi:hypothetical protein